KDAPEGIKVVGPDGKALPTVREVAKICAQQKLVRCTGHASPTEVIAIVEAARDAGCDRIVVTHAEFEVVNMTVEQMKKAAAMGAKMEIDAMGPLMGPNAHLPFMRHWRQVTYKESASHIKEVGAQSFVLGTDLGQTGNPSQPDGYQLLVAGLLAERLTRDPTKTTRRQSRPAVVGFTTSTTRSVSPRRSSNSTARAPDSAFAASANSPASRRASDRRDSAVSDTTRVAPAGRVASTSSSRRAERRSVASSRRRVVSPYAAAVAASAAKTPTPREPSAPRRMTRNTSLAGESTTASTRPLPS